MNTKLFSFLLLTFISLASCSKPDVEDPTTGGTGSSGQFSAKVEGSTFTPTNLTATLNKTTLIFGIIATDNQKNQVTIAGPAAVGTYTTTTDGVGGIYINANGDTWLAGSADDIISLTVTKYDASTKKISGTFSFKAVGATSNSTKTITEGTFTDVALLAL